MRFRKLHLAILVPSIGAVFIVTLAIGSIIYTDVTNRPNPIVHIIQAILIKGPQDNRNIMNRPIATIGSTVYSTITKKMNSPKALVTNSPSQKVSQTRIPNLQDSQNQGLQNLGKLQDTYHTFIAGQLMLFISQGGLQDNMLQAADDFSSTLKEFASKGVVPLVIVEPTDLTGHNLPLDELHSDAYINSFTSYLTELQNDGISDTQMGTWVFLPEENLPEWDRGTTTPADYASLINTYIGLLKQIFPNAKGSIMLSSQTFSGTYTNSTGTFTSLAPYVNGIKKGLVDTFGFQGFPWLPAANTIDTPILDPSEFLKPSLATEAANILGVKNIWINSGTFSDMYMNDPQAAVHIPDSERSSLLAGIIDEANKIKQSGFSVSINLFAADKSKTAEATNWSYTANPSLLTPFIAKAQQNNIPLSLFTEQ